MCRDFKLGLCQRPQCKYIHLIEGKYRVKSGNFGQQVNSDSDIVCFTF